MKSFAVKKKVQGEESVCGLRCDNKIPVGLWEYQGYHDKYETSLPQPLGSCDKRQAAPAFGEKLRSEVLSGDAVNEEAAEPGLGPAFLALRPFLLAGSEWHLWSREEMNNPCHQVPLTQLTAASGSCFVDVFSMLRHHGFNEIAQAPTRLPRAWVSPGAADTQLVPEASPAAPEGDDRQRAGNDEAGGVPWWRGGTAWRPRSGCGQGRMLSARGRGRGWVPELGDDMCREICHLVGPAAHCCRTGLLGDSCALPSSEVN